MEDMTTTDLCKFAKLTDPGQWDGQTTRAIADAVGVAQTTVIRHQHGRCKCSTEAPKPKAKPAAKPEKLATVTPINDKVDTSREHVEVGPEGGEFTGIKSEGPLTNWDHIFAKFDLDPAEFQIVDDTVRASVWQQSKRTEDGDRDIVNLYAYRARFTRRAHVPQDRLDDMIAAARNWRPATAAIPATFAQPVSAMIGLADWQLGKGEGDGTPGTVKRITRALSLAVRWIEARRAEGHNIERIVLANMGDHTEAVQGSYASQTHSVDLNMRDQLSLALELNLEWIKAMRELAPVLYTAALCNHGQWQRAAGSHDSITGDADNSTGFIADQLATVCKMVPKLADVEFVIPRDEMITKATVSGVNVAMAHGHKISGKEDQWLAAQSQALTQREKFIPDLWVTAHRHHASVDDFGPYSRIQCTTEDPGSKWIYDAKGVYSTTGTTAFLVGDHLPMKWTSYEVLV